jgi:hypothetical protein
VFTGSLENTIDWVRDAELGRYTASDAETFFRNTAFWL